MRFGWHFAETWEDVFGTRVDTFGGSGEAVWKVFNRKRQHKNIQKQHRYSKIC